MKYDVVIPCGTRDVHRVSLCVESIKFLNPQPERIYIVTPNRDDASGLKSDIPIQVVTDDEVFRFNRKGPTPNWIFQQFIKLFQGVTKNDLYLAVDSDLVFVKPFDVFGYNGKKIFWRYSFANEPDSVYKLIKEAIGVDKVLPYHMMCHFMMFDRKLCGELLDEFIKRHPSERLNKKELFYSWDVENHKKESFYDWVIDNYKEGELTMSEWETYSNFVESRYPGLYDVKKIGGWDLPMYVPISKGVVMDVIKNGVGGVKINDEVMVVTVHSRVGQDSF